MTESTAMSDTPRTDALFMGLIFTDDTPLQVVRDLRAGVQKMERELASRATPEGCKAHDHIICDKCGQPLSASPSPPETKER